MLLLIGTGPMAIEYVKVLKALNQPFTVIGRGSASGTEFTKQTKVQASTGGLETAISSGQLIGTNKAIVAVGVEALYDISMALLKLGVKNLLVEKPGVLNPDQLKSLSYTANKNNAQVYIAYNRRFLCSTRRAREIIKSDGGVSSFTFDFTEWGHEIEPLNKGPKVKEYWILSNSSHVIDLAFNLGGKPQEINSLATGSLNWHHAGSVFVGSGITVDKVPFAYHANWASAGRWGLEFCTKNYKLILRPMEKLQIMKKGSVQIEEINVNADDLALDTNFKPGLYRQVEAFLGADLDSLCSIEEMAANFNTYCKIAGYYQ